jgi:hypothetical protein
MNCQLCLEPFDSSFRKPYHISCPHTFCIICLNDLKENVCPNCKKLITEKHPNEAIMELILKTKNEKLNQINKQLNHFKASNSYLDNSQLMSATSSGSIVQKGTVQNKPFKATAIGSNDQKSTVQNKPFKTSSSPIVQKGTVQNEPFKAIAIGSNDPKGTNQNKPPKAKALSSNDQKENVQNKQSKAKDKNLVNKKNSAFQNNSSKAIANLNNNISKVKKIEAKNRTKHKKIIKKDIFKNQAKKPVKRIIKPSKYLTEKQFFRKKFFHGKRKSMRKCKRNIATNFKMNIHKRKENKKECSCPLADNRFQGFNFLKPKS